MAGKGGATVEARYKEHIKYTPTPITSVAVVADGASGLTGSTAPSKDKDAKDADKKDDAPKKKGFGLGALKPAPRRKARARRCRHREAPGELVPIAPPRAAAIRRS